jgi:predicted PurR-regulated permease PerM
MQPTQAQVERFRNAFVLLLVVAISALFFATIRGFLMALLMAGLFTALWWPVHARICSLLGGRETPAALLSVLLLLLSIGLPGLFFAGVVTAQAVEITESAQPWVRQQIALYSAGEGFFGSLGLPAFLQPYESQILQKLGELAGSAGGFLVNLLAAATRGTVTFFFLLFVMLYAMFFFLRDGREMLGRILYVTPLSSQDEYRLVARFASVSRATLKGTLVIGAVQGGLAGAAFAVAGIGGAAFWGTLMAVLSIIPGLGTALVWVPAVIHLFVTGQTVAAVGLGLWCGVVVGLADNVLRPMLVGKDTQMSDLMILISTLGGLVLFGAAGILVGPLIAALFVTVWDIYAVTFRDYLPEVVPIGSSPAPTESSPVEA